MATLPLIRLKDALALLDGPAPVAVQWVKLDRRRKTGGDFGRLKAARIGSGKRQAAGVLRAPRAGEETDADRAAVTADGLVPVPTGEKSDEPTPKNPAHWVNATRNLVDTQTGALVKIHIYLLTHVAGRKVLV
ncbi:hypothetical protein Q5H93_12415 [Hymenobacter sp. ASUV-10]|uniref:Uncharacterized protein n=1 Tax=Hymenobacter aranciens TaxID=3063996 RepID=A0ABT9BB95_9BACT|nr:hypothetical protein [Hymenobacter sp. ASUV-10]MDO7875539.1 hypothetical protein [Hymenobacter sp. ASUV-10]